MTRQSAFFFPSWLIALALWAAGMAGGQRFEDQTILFNILTRHNGLTDSRFWLAEVALPAAGGIVLALLAGWIAARLPKSI
jgi:hypothetical protein